MEKRALVLVLGELARSPRMQYHCLSLANNRYQVTVIATGADGNRGGGDRCVEELESHPRITKRLIADGAAASVTRYLPRVVGLAIKAVWQTLLLLQSLLLLPQKPHLVLVQNPPSIPTLPLCFLYARLAGCKLVIDWHNYGFTILALKLGPHHLFTRLYRWLEMLVGRWADAGFCVSQAMRDHLKNTFSIRYPLQVLYDRPPKHFKPLNLVEKHAFFLQVRASIPVFKSAEEEFDQQQQIPVGANERRRETRFTMTDVFERNVVLLKPRRPALIMSSTSWTQDERFDTLLEALVLYDSLLSDRLMNQEEPGSVMLPQVVCVITGRGPLKAHYEALIARLNLKNVELVLPWLEAPDYPRMVGSCDLGVSLHASSSGLDLPMKVVDMFGCGIPVLAHHYPAINELVREDFFGLTFADSRDLFEKLVLMLSNWDNSPIHRYKKNIKRHFLVSRWEDNWDKQAKPLLDEQIGFG